MAALKAFTVLLLVGSAISMSYGQEEMKSVIFKRVHCEASERYIHNFTCYAKSTTSVSKLSIHGFSKKPIESFYIVVRAFVKFGFSFVEAFHTPKIYWCEIMDLQAENFMLQHLRDFVDIIVPNVADNIHQCPYTKFDARNVTITSNRLVSFVPTGDYKLSIHLHQEDDDFIGAAVVEASIVPS